MKKTDLQEIIQVLNNFDPISLLVLGAPDDEYSDEAKQILAGLSNDMPVEEVESLVRKTFIHNFDDGIVGRYNFQLIAQEIKKIKK